MEWGLRVSGICWAGECCMHNFCYVNGIFGPVYRNNFACRLRHKKELYVFLDGSNVVKYIRIRSLQWAGHVVWMDKIRRKVLDGKFRGRDLREDCDWDGRASGGDFSMLLNIRGWRRIAGVRDMWRQTIKEARAWCGLSCHWIRRNGYLDF
jgi:hypothetical protein